MSSVIVTVYVIDREALGSVTRFVSNLREVIAGEMSSYLERKMDSNDVSVTIPDLYPGSVLSNDCTVVILTEGHSSMLRSLAQVSERIARRLGHHFHGECRRFSVFFITGALAEEVSD